jgi:hypothetical protein
LARGRIEREPIDLRKACSETVSRVPLPGADKADDRRRRLLRVRRERPRRGGAEQRYERAALHSITSSARASSASGTSRPRDLAAFRLTPTVLAAKQATSVIPIVFATAGDPVGSGLVATLARPGGNVTGVSSQGSDAAGKRLELLREVVPGLRRFGVLANLASSYPALELSEVQAASRTLGLDVSPFDIRRAQDIVLAFEALKGHAEALYVIADPLASTNRIRINTLALGVRLPTMSEPIFTEFPGPTPCQTSTVESSVKSLHPGYERTADPRHKRRQVVVRNGPLRPAR